MKWSWIPIALAIVLVIAFSQERLFAPQHSPSTLVETPATELAPMKKAPSVEEPVSAQTPVPTTNPVVAKDPVTEVSLPRPSSAAKYRLLAPEPAVKTGHFVLVNKSLNVLWHYNDGTMVEAYRVATGRDTTGPAPTWKDYATNFFTPEGTFKLTNFVVEPTYTALKPGDQSYAGGAPGNPLGTRWMGFTVLDSDNAWVWGIHGTSEPEKIGLAVSDGCIRMLTAEVELLFDQIQGKNPVLQVVGK